MKKILIALMAITIGLSTTSCFKKMKEAKEGLEETTTGFKNLNKAAKELQKSQKDIEKLSELDPLSNDDFKDWMPEKVKDLDRTGFKLGVAAYANIAGAEIDFANEDKSKKLQVEILDGAGPMGAAATMAFRMMTAIDMEEESDRGYKKTIKKGDTKYLVEHNTASNRTEVSFLSDNRFGVKVTGNGIDQDELFTYIKAMDFNKLN